MIQTGPVLRTWALEAEPFSDRSIPAAALVLPDHRLAYLNYEGPISGNRGNVTRCAAGGFEIIAETPTRLELRLTSLLMVWLGHDLPRRRQSSTLDIRFFRLSIGRSISF